MRFFYLLLGYILILKADSVINPLPHILEQSPQKELGRALFFDPNLSRDKKVSCATCHKKEYGGSNGKRYGEGVFGRKTRYNVPSIYNLKYQYIFGWKGNIYSLRKKIEDVMKNPNIFDANFTQILTYLRNNSFYKQKFEKIFGKIDKETLLRALEAYVASLVTPDSKFDRFLLHKASLRKDELEGYRLFKQLGCIACHNGKAIGGQMRFQFGYFHKKKKKIVKCPSLRNVALSAPYFDDGSVASLFDAVKQMAKYQLGRDIDDETASKIVQFLRTLTGKCDD